MESDGYDNDLTPRMCGEPPEDFFKEMRRCASYKDDVVRLELGYNYTQRNLLECQDNKL